MEQTLGKRIVSHRKTLGLTQDQLAEKLGVTAQAVSKWENDQSCPDIGMLPKLATIFGISTDELLGMESSSRVHHAEVIDPKEVKKNASNAKNGHWEFHYNAGRKGYIVFALWILLTGGLLLAANLLSWDTGFWDILWPTGLLVFGLSKFSFFRLGCAFFGGWSLLNNLGFAPFDLGKELLFPIFILLFGLSLLADALGKKKKPSIRFFHTDDSPREKKHSTSLEQEDDAFSCSTCFGEDSYVVDLDTLAEGEASVSFGGLTVDLSGCSRVSDGCSINADCSFGSLVFLVPRRFRVIPGTDTSFASVDISGEPDAAAQGLIQMDCDVSFGSIEIRYI